MPEQKPTGRKRLFLRLLLLPFLLLFFLITLSEFLPIPYLPSWSRLALLTSDHPPVDVSDVPVSVHFIDANQSDCTLVMAYGKTLLIDTGDALYRRQVLRYLQNQQVERIDYLLLTHPHADHMGNLKEILETYPVGAVILSRPPEELTPTTVSYQEMVKALLSSGAEIKEAHVGDTYSLGNAKLRILSTGAGAENLNDASLACKLICSPEHSFLFTGDAEKAGEQALLAEKADLRATVLHLGHHGSSTSSTPELLDAVSPSYAIISCGRDNSYRFPHESVLRRLEERGILFYRTDKSGDIVFKVNPDNSIQVVTTQ